MAWHWSRARRLAARSQVECSLRVSSGSIDGLSHRWRAGLASLSTGEIRFRRFIPPGIRVTIPLAADVVVKPQGIGLGHRRPGSRESWSISPGCAVLFITTSGAEIEWAVLEEQVEWALGIVRPSIRGAS